MTVPLMATAHPPGITAAPKMSDEMFRSTRDFIYQNTGIYFQDNKKYLLEGRLGKRLQVLEIDDFETYLQLVRFGTQKAAEMKFLYDAVTINETFFFRNEPQFEAFERTLVPQLVAARGTSKTKLKLWSAASSSGEEAYTLAMIYLERLRLKYPDWRSKLSAPISARPFSRRLVREFTANTQCEICPRCFSINISKLLTGASMSSPK